MKQINLFIVALLFSVSAKAQIVDTVLTFTTGITTMKIVPAQISVFDTVTARGIGVKIVGDNLFNDCTLYYQVVDSMGHALWRGNIDVTGSDYANWTGDNVYPFTYVVGKLKLTLK